jgi:hypothetical protein
MGVLLDPRCTVSLLRCELCCEAWFAAVPACVMWMRSSRLAGAAAVRVPVSTGTKTCAFARVECPVQAGAAPRLSGAHRGLARASAQVPIPREQIHAIKEGLPVGEAATEYAGQLLRLDAGILPRNAQGAAARRGHQLNMGRSTAGMCECEASCLIVNLAGRAADHFRVYERKSRGYDCFAGGAGLPVFDVVLLGTGPDGHVASLFPNWPQTAAREGLVLPISGSPKPPPERITMTMPVINRCGALQGRASCVHCALRSHCHAHRHDGRAHWHGYVVLLVMHTEQEVSKQGCSILKFLV